MLDVWRVAAKREPVSTRVNDKIFESKFDVNPYTVVRISIVTESPLTLSFGRISPSTIQTCHESNLV